MVTEVPYYSRSACNGFGSQQAVTLDRQGYKQLAMVAKFDCLGGRAPVTKQLISKEEGKPMLSDDLIKRLEGIEDATRKGFPIRNLYRLMCVKDLWIEAYTNVQSNAGAITKGVDNNTLDGFSYERVDQIVQKLRERKYEPKPVRRTFIPKANGKLRPLGIPTGDDKLAQEVARIMLERVYEPVFSDDSHGFRRGRSCHTALSRFEHGWDGTKWLIDVDIKGFFDNIDHDVLLALLRKKVDDKCFVDLIGKWLKAGYVENWVYERTHSGTPQGGVISPLLANVYLHELDLYIESIKKDFVKGKKRRKNPDYEKYSRAVKKCRQQLDTVLTDDTRVEEVKRLKAEIDRLSREMRCLPSLDMADPEFKRLNYCRYADDFVIGVTGTLEDARNIMNAVRSFITNVLHLEVNEEKTKIHHIDTGIRFLGYEVRSMPKGRLRKYSKAGRHTIRRTTNAKVSLFVPTDVASKFCHKHGYGSYQETTSLHRPNLLHNSDTEIVLTYNAELRGIAQYYALAKDVKQKLAKLFFIAQYSLLKTIAGKYKTKVGAVAARMRHDGELLHGYRVKGKEQFIRVFRLKHLRRFERQELVDLKPVTAIYTFKRTELVARLNADRCEYCGKGGGCQVHHVRKLKDVAQKRNKTLLDIMMIRRRRKTMVLCVDCHGKLHRGTLPDLRYAEMI